MGWRSTVKRFISSADGAPALSADRIDVDAALLEKFIDEASWALYEAGVAQTMAYQRERGVTGHALVLLSPTDEDRAILRAFAMAVCGDVAALLAANSAAEGR